MEMTGEDNWYVGVKRYMEENNINIEEENIKEKTYKLFKAEVKQKIEEKVKRDILKKKEVMTKLRFIKPEIKQKYVMECSIEEARIIMKIRLNMIWTRTNYKRKNGNIQCRICGEKEETTDHIIECYTGGNELFQEEGINNVQWLKRIQRTYREIDEYNRQEEVKYELNNESGQ